MWAHWVRAGGLRDGTFVGAKCAAAPTRAGEAAHWGQCAYSVILANAQARWRARQAWYYFDLIVEWVCADVWGLLARGFLHNNVFRFIRRAQLAGWPRQC